MITNRLHLSDALWRKSSYSANGANCVEIASNLPGAVAMRDTKDRDGATLVTSTHAWSVFAAGIKRGEFDL
jgi:Domain of unknown function (DUF397)